MISISRGLMLPPIWWKLPPLLPGAFAILVTAKSNSIFSPNYRNKICMSSLGNCDMKMYYMCLYV